LLLKKDCHISSVLFDVCVSGQQSLSATAATA
jgi:hypothetical protein